MLNKVLEGWRQKNGVLRHVIFLLTGPQVNPLSIHFCKGLCAAALEIAPLSCFLLLLLNIADLP
jgi:hypothetical protein